MNARQPLVPIRELQGDGNLTRIEVTVRPKDVRRNLPGKFTKARSMFAWIWPCYVHSVLGPSNKIRKCVRVTVEDPGESSACRPARDWLLVQSGSRLVRRVPWAARVGRWQTANVACDLLALEGGQAMEACA